MYVCIYLTCVERSYTYSCEPRKMTLESLKNIIAIIELIAKWFLWLFSDWLTVLCVGYISDVFLTVHPARVDVSLPREHENLKTNFVKWVPWLSDQT